MSEDQTIEQIARSAAVKNISTLLLSSSEDVLRSLIDNPALDETHLCLLLERKGLSGTLLELIAKRKQWNTIYRVRCALAAHPHTPRAVAMRMLRDLHLMDLVRISLLTATSAEVRRLAEERVLTQLPQLPLGQKFTLARRGSARIVAGLLAQGPEQVAQIALANTRLTESQLLRILAKRALSAGIVAAIAKHEKWSKLLNVRIALLRHAHVPGACVATFVADLPRREIEHLLLERLSPVVRVHLGEELARLKDQRIQ